MALPRNAILATIAAFGLLAAAPDNAPILPDPAIAAHAVPAGAEPVLPAARLLALLRQRVKYVFVIYQENRSFDGDFGSFPGAENLYAHPPNRTPGFFQSIQDENGKPLIVQPFRIGPAEFAADTDDIDHSHTGIVAKMDVQNGVARMDRFAAQEQAAWLAHGAPPRMARQAAELTMAHLDCDSIPFLWRYANRFTLFDHIFQQMTGPSTPGNLSIIAAQTGDTQWARHPDQAYAGNGDHAAGEPVVNDRDPLAGSPEDKSAAKMPANPADFRGPHAYAVQRNQTYATLPLTLGGREIGAVVGHDADKAADLADVAQDVPAIAGLGRNPVGWAWYQAGYDNPAPPPGTPDTSPVDAAGLHAAYITHHNGPQYFGYIANNPELRAHLHGLPELDTALAEASLPADGGLFYIKGGYRNAQGLRPADPDKRAQQAFLGDDDHPGYSDAQISEALVARMVNEIARSRYWAQAAIILTWDDSEGAYDHLPPPIRRFGPDGSITGDGPRVPLLLISPYARSHAVVAAPGNHASVVKFVDALFRLPPLALLPDELEGRRQGQLRFHQRNLGPDDALSPDITDLLPGFDPARLASRAPPLPADYAEIPDNVVAVLPQASAFGCRAIGLLPQDRKPGFANPMPADFNPRPKTEPSVAK